MKAQVSSVFYLLLFVTVAFLSSYIIYTLNTKNANILAKEVNVRIEQTKLPVFDIRDVSYSEYGSVASISFTFTNLGDNVELKNWMIEFLSGDMSRVICRALILTGDPNEAARISSSFTVTNRNVTLDVGGIIQSGDVVNVELTLLQTCLNETIQYARSEPKMIFKLYIPPTYRTAILTCSVDSNTGYATCTE